MKSRSICLGLIGAGRWGRNYIKTIRHIHGVELTQLVSRNPESIDLVGANCNIFEDWRQVIQKKKVDGLIIAVPAKYQTRIALSAIAEGFPVMLEKPLALNIKDVLRLSAAARKSRLTVLVDHTYLFHPVFKRLKNLIRDKEEITTIRSHGWNWGPFRKEIDPLWDWGPHDLSMCIDLMGEVPKIVDANIVESIITPEGEGRIVNFTLRFSSGSIADITIGNAGKHKKRYFEVNLSKTKMIVFDDCVEQKLFIINDDSVHFPGYSNDLPLTVAVKTFIDGIKGKQDARLGITTGEQVCYLLNEIQSILNSKSNRLCKT